jgi:predicted transcriptional regulator
MAEEDKNDITALTVQLLSAYVSRNSVSSESLADLIRTTRTALTEDAAAAIAEPAAQSFTPAVSVRKSLASPDHILSLIDGRAYKTLKRHLAAHGLTPEQYRERYKLPSSYPLVAQSYSQTRRAVAEKTGLGRKPTVAASAAASPQAPAAVADPAPSPATKKAAASKAPAKAVTPKAATPKKDKADAPVPVISNRGNRAAPASASKQSRKRLSIAAPKGDKENGKAAASPKASSQDKSAAKKAAPAKPKSLKAALEAANSHLGSDGKAAETTAAKS